MNDEILTIFEEVIGNAAASFDSFTGDLFEFSSETSSKLFDAVLDLVQSEQKDAIKLGLKSILKLDDRDLVFFRDQKIFIRKAKNIHPVSKEILRRISALAERYNTVERVEMQVVNNCLSIYISEILEDTELDSTILTQEVKDFIKVRLRQEIAISDKDAVVFIGDKIIVRRFVENVDDNNKKMEQRYNGLPKEDLETIRKKIFSDDQNEQLVFRTIMDNALEGDLNFSYITFGFFEKNYIKILQKYLLAFLMENLEEDEQILLGVGNLALRENWVFVHRCMAEKIIELLSVKTPSTEAFLKCYSGDITLGEDRTRYKMPEVIDKNDKKWNAPTIFSMVLQYKKNLETIDQRKKGADIYIAKSNELVEEIKKVEQEAVGWEASQSIIEQELAGYYAEEIKLNEELKMDRNKMKSITNDQEKIT
jgi:predicted amino acid-binding ACT domain protein